MNPIRKRLADIATNNGYRIKGKDSSEVTVTLDRMQVKFEAVVEKTGNMYCPCQIQQNEDTICPCKYMRNYSACRCGLFIKEVR